MTRSGSFKHWRNNHCTTFLIGWLFSSFLSTTVQAQGNLLVMPRRVVFDGAVKSQELNLANTGNDTARYNISIIDVRMKEDGGFETISEPDSGQNFAGRYLRFFPRSVTLAPNESQVVKMQLSRSSGMQPGEYRSHIYFRAEPAGEASGKAFETNDSSISIRLVPVFGISVPVIIRIGETAAQVSLSRISFQLLKDSIPRLTLALDRQGNRSVYGDLVVNIVPSSGKAYQVAAVKGIAVYTPNASRLVQLDLARIPGVDYHSGKLQLIYSSSSDTKYVRFAEAAVMLH